MREINFGDLQGLQEKQLKELPIWQQFLRNPADIAFPNGDRVMDVQKRIFEGLEGCSRQFGDTDDVVCVAHAEVLLLAISRFLGLPMEQMHHLSLDPASVTKLEWTTERKKLKLLNYQPYGI